MPYQIEYACVNIKGGVRESNQDNFYAQKRYRYGSEKFNDITKFGTVSSEDNAILAVYDGMGGESCGDMASLLASRGTLDFDCMPGDGAEVLRDLCLSLNDAVCEFAWVNHIRTMGSTAAILRFEPSCLYCCNLGDSRIYKLRAGGIQQLSRDHSVKDYYRKKAPLTQYLGIPSDEILITPHIVREDYAPGTRYLACSDGITDMISDEEIARIVAAAPSVREGTLTLVSTALQHGGVDNITAILCEIKA